MKIFISILCLIISCSVCGQPRPSNKIQKGKEIIWSNKLLPGVRSNRKWSDSCCVEIKGKHFIESDTSQKYWDSLMLRAEPRLGENNTTNWTGTFQSVRLISGYSGSNPKDSLNIKFFPK